MFAITKALHEHERKITSQFGEDGVIARIAQDLGIENGSFFEFGIGPEWQHSFEQAGLEGNCVRLRSKGWKGVFADGGALPIEAGVERAFITAFNINEVWDRYDLPVDVDVLSIDVDGQEFWIWLALMKRPKIVVVEYNGSIPAGESRTIQFDLGHVWDGTLYHGASLLALDRLGSAKGYVLVWANGVNCIFVRDDLVANQGDFSFDEIYRAWPAHAPDPRNRVWVGV
jgi:hypothetical protein